MGFARRLKDKLSPQLNRDKFVVEQLSMLPPGIKILDAGAGSQMYRKNCSHLEYKAQDFGKYENDDKLTLGQKTVGGESGYQYGPIDYVGDIWNIDEKDGTFDAILCTEVFEHIPYPVETLREFSRLLKAGGKLIITLPSNSLRHMDPYYYYSGFSDRWLEYFLSENNFSIKRLDTVGDYNRWMALESAKTFMRAGIIGKLISFLSFAYFYSKKPTEESANTLCIGYHLVAEKRD